MNTTTEIPGQLIWKSVWLLTSGRRRSTGQRDDSGPWRDRAGQCEISSRYSEWGAISNFSIVYSWNCPFTTFGQQLSVAETTETEALVKSGLLYYTHTHTHTHTCARVHTLLGFLLSPCLCRRYSIYLGCFLPAPSLKALILLQV